MNEIDKLYLLHDFTEYAIEHGKETIDVQVVDDFIESKKGNTDCYVEAVTCFDEIENYLLMLFDDFEITRRCEITK